MLKSELIQYRYSLVTLKLCDGVFSLLWLMWQKLAPGKKNGSELAPCNTQQSFLILRQRQYELLSSPVSVKRV